MVRAGDVSLMGVMNLLAAVCLCFVPVVVVGFVQHLVTLDRHEAQTERRIQALERASRAAKAWPVPEPVAQRRQPPGVPPVLSIPPTALASPCATVPDEPVVPLCDGYYLVRSGALACAVEHGQRPFARPIVRTSPTQDPPGLRVEGVPDAGLVASMGLREGDVVTRVDHVPVRTPATLGTALERALDRHRLALTVRRAGRIRTLHYVIER